VVIHLSNEAPLKLVFCFCSSAT